MSFDDLPEQPEARRLLTAAVAEGPAHAYLLHGPAGVGKRAAARMFASALLGDERRVAAGTHPDLFSLEALGEMIRIDEVRALHRDLHMRPYEAERRVYVIADAHLLNEDAADALLKDLEERPIAYGAAEGKRVAFQPGDAILFGSQSRFGHQAGFAQARLSAD